MNETSHNPAHPDPLNTAASIAQASEILAGLPIPPYLRRQMLRRWAVDHNFKLDDPQLAAALTEHKGVN